MTFTSCIYDFLWRIMYLYEIVQYFEGILLWSSHKKTHTTFCVFFKIFYFITIGDKHVIENNVLWKHVYNSCFNWIEKYFHRERDI